MKRLAALTLLCGILALNPTTAQDRKPDPPDPTPVKFRTHYVVRNADPVVLAEVVGKHFRGEADVLAAPAGSGNAVLVSGLPAVVPEVVKLLETLDRKPRSVEVEVVLVEVPAPKDGKELTPADLGTAGVLAKEGKGQRIKLTSVEGQPVTTTTGGNKAIVTSSGAFAGGRFGKDGGPVTQRSVSYQPVGTTVKMTPRVGSDDSVSLDLTVQESKVRPSEEEGGAPSFDNNTLSTRLSVPAGKPVVAQAVRVDGKAGPTVAVVVVTARVIDAAPRGP